MHLYLIGFSRAGKSTLARQLANSWNVPAFDTDEMIERQCGQSVADIVAAKGWDAFRELESRILLELGTLASPSAFPVAVACGGGIVELEQNRAFLKQQKLIWLNPSWELIYTRLLRHPSAISLDKSESELKELYRHRSQLYREIMYPCVN